jgi:L-cysteate sulfo-lyase
MIHSVGSTGTQVGLLLGQSISKYETTIIGMSAARKSDIQQEITYELAKSTANMLGVPFDEPRIIVDDNYIGSGYSIPSEEGQKAANLFATMEGVLLDYVYTGKAAAGLIDYASNQRFEADENILFIHTGGNSGLFY